MSSTQILAWVLGASLVAVEYRRAQFFFSQEIDLARLGLFTGSRRGVGVSRFSRRLAVFFFFE